MTKKDTEVMKKIMLMVLFGAALAATSCTNEDISVPEIYRDYGDGIQK